MPTAAQVLATFAAELTFEDIPAEVVRRAKDCIADTVRLGRRSLGLPSLGPHGSLADASYGGAGPCSIIGIPDLHVHAPLAALANGVAAHAFELDSVGKANCGSHPGATLVPALLATCEEMRASGTRALTAFVAGCEVAVRIGAASRHSSENLGFHAPGLNGPYAAAVAAGVVAGLDSKQLANAIGIAGSLSSGLLAFTKSQQGGMVKRLHLGRASESGILAARLASAGYEGPETVLDGKFGFLDTYCRDGDPDLLSEGLTRSWETLHISIEALSVPSLCAHASAGDARTHGRARLNRRRCGSRDSGRKSRTGEPSRHPRARGYHESAIQRPFLCRPRIVSRSRGPALVRPECTPGFRDSRGVPPSRAASAG